jgi:hypothetical protein
MSNKSLSGIDDAYGSKSLIMFDSTTNTLNINNISSQNEIYNFFIGLQKVSTISIPNITNNASNSLNVTDTIYGSITSNDLIINGVTYLNGEFISTIGTR